MSGRHLGLETVHDDDPAEWSGTLIGMLEDVDVDRIREIASDVSHLPDLESGPAPTKRATGLVAAVPYDRAFCFYYPENIEMLEAAGFRIQHYSPLKGDQLPEADLHYLGGGYPELYAEMISDNIGFLHGLRNAHNEGVTIVGECGGMLVMAETLCSLQGTRHKMAGILPADAFMTSERQGLAYVEAAPVDHPSARVRGHEFHYSRMELREDADFHYDILRGRGIDGRHDGVMVGSAEGRYMHRHALSEHDPVSDMVGAVLDRLSRER